MKNTQSYIHVFFASHNNCLTAKCICNDKIDIHEIKMAGLNLKDVNTSTYIMWWVLNKISPLFLEMPVDSIKVDAAKDCSWLKNILDIGYNCLNQTNEVLKKYRTEKECASQNQNVLFFNANHHANIKTIYDECRSRHPDRIRYLNLDPGFDHVERKWKKTPPPLSVEEFVAYIKDNQIKTIVSMNMYLLEKYLDKGVYIQALFKFLGVEYIIVDLDGYDLSPSGYQNKEFYNVPSFKRFSYSEFQVFWDRYYKMANVNRIAFTHKAGQKFSFQELRPDYVIAITTNSRLDNVIPMLNSIVFILDHLNDDTFFEEFQLWYYSMRYMVQEVMDLNELERLKYNGLLYHFAFTVSQFLKYEIIENINSDREIALHGDIGWKTVFPGHYRNYLDREGVDKLYTGGRSINLLMNWILNWFEGSAAIFQAINYRVPFLSHPAVAKSKPLEGMRFVEYHDPQDLNWRLDNFDQCINEELINSIEHLNRYSNKNIAFMASEICREEGADGRNDDMLQEFMKHDELLRGRINDYCIKNEPFLRYSFASLFIKSEPFNIKTSKFYSKNYMQRLLHYAANK